MRNIKNWTRFGLAALVLGSIWVGGCYGNGNDKSDAYASKEAEKAQSETMKQSANQEIIDAARTK